MLVILGFILLIAALVVGVAGVVTSGGGAHGLTGGFSVFGYEITGSTGTPFLDGIAVGRRTTYEGRRAMSIGKKIAHKAEAVKGGAKKTVGRITGNWHLQAEGRGDQVKGNTKQAGAKIKDAFKH
ncbi:CsbD family protein [Streptomyces sp. NPDC058401]|uniref:CsbD family protein n=1 Tax=Streptomyces sp. NPDC058401 TaxID=3346480 RepID=UPI00364CB0CA